MKIRIPIPAPVAKAGPLRVAVVPRLVPAFSYGLAVAGAGISAFLVRQAFLAMTNAETAGIGAVTRGLAEANVPLLIALYLAIVSGAAGLLVLIIRMFVNTTKASPPVWFVMVTGILGLIPAGLFWWAESLVIGVFYPDSGGIVAVANMVALLLPSIMIAAPFILLLLLAISVWPVRSLSKPKWGPIVVLLMFEVALVVMAVAFQLRTSWLFQVSQAEQLLP